MCLGVTPLVREEARLKKKLKLGEQDSSGSFFF